jgi:hypothetical protein
MFVQVSFFCRFTGIARQWGRHEESGELRVAAYRDWSVEEMES